MKVIVLAWLLVAQQIVALIFSLDFFPLTDHRIFADYRHLSQMKAYRLQKRDGHSQDFLLDDDKFSFNYRMEREVLKGASDLSLIVKTHLKEQNLSGTFALYETSIPDLNQPLIWKNERLLEVTVSKEQQDD